MKKLLLTIVLLCSTMAITAQNYIQVNYQGEKPTIGDFAWALLSNYNNAWDDEGDNLDEATYAAKEAWINYRKNIPQDEGDEVIVDQKNGYAVYNSRHDRGLLRVEMCYWNEADQKHKLIAYNVTCYVDGKFFLSELPRLEFYRYNNATKKMICCDAPGFIDYGWSDGAAVSYDLPRYGKDIICTYWYENGKKKQKKLKWNGRKFSF